MSLACCSWNPLPYEKKLCLFLVTAFCLTAHGSNKLGCPNKSEAISYSPGPALKVWQLDGSMGGTVYVCLHLSKKWTKCRCIKTIHYMDPMDLLTWLFVTCWFYVFFWTKQVPHCFSSKRSTRESWGHNHPFEHVQLHVKSQVLGGRVGWLTSENISFIFTVAHQEISSTPVPRHSSQS